MESSRRLAAEPPGAQGILPATVCRIPIASGHGAARLVANRVAFEPGAADGIGIRQPLGQTLSHLGRRPGSGTTANRARNPAGRRRLDSAGEKRKGMEGRRPPACVHIAMQGIGTEITQTGWSPLQTGIFRRRLGSAAYLGPHAFSLRTPARHRCGLDNRFAQRKHVKQKIREARFRSSELKSYSTRLSLAAAENARRRSPEREGIRPFSEIVESRCGRNWDREFSHSI